MLLLPESKPSTYSPIGTPSALAGGRFVGMARSDVLTSGTVDGYVGTKWVQHTSASISDELEALLASSRELWRFRVSNRHAATDRKSLKATAEATFELLTRSGPSALDLWKLDAGRVNGLHLAMVLRCAFSWRHSIKGWDAAVNMAKKALIAEGRDPNDGLYGLI